MAPEYRAGWSLGAGEPPRSSPCSLTGVVLGVAFFLALSSLMRGSEKDFIKRVGGSIDVAWRPG